MATGKFHFERPYHCRRVRGPEASLVLDRLTTADAMAIGLAILALGGLFSYVMAFHQAFHNPLPRHPGENGRYDSQN